ncbi:MAG: hypothetical protein GDA51_13475 [Ekhidna sp.]|nr:hypothetical protein [Ekhidna sp.]
MIVIFIQTQRDEKTQNLAKQLLESFKLSKSSTTNACFDFASVFFV